MKLFFLLFFSSLVFADLQKCVEDYNSGVTERNNGLGAYKLAQTQKIEADGKISAAERKRYIQEAKASIISAIDILNKSESILKYVQIECVQSIGDKAAEISLKNKKDLGEFELFKKDMELTLQLPK